MLPKLNAMPFFTDIPVVPTTSTATDDSVPSIADVAAVAIVVYAERINCIGKTWI